MVLDTFISIAEAATRIGTTEAQVRKMVDAGTIKGVLVNGQSVVKERSINRKERSINKMEPRKQKNNPLMSHQV